MKNENNEEIEGSFERGDRAKNILFAKKDFNKDIICLIEWFPRDNGIIPLCSVVNSKLLRKEDPQLLINFYEKRIVFKECEISKERSEEVYKLFNEKI